MLSSPRLLCAPASSLTGQYSTAQQQLKHWCVINIFFLPKPKHNIISDTTKKTSSVPPETRTQCPANFEHMIISLKWRDESASVSECWCRPTTERWSGAGLGNVSSLDLTYLALLAAEQRAYFRNMKPRKIKWLTTFQMKNWKSLLQQICFMRNKWPLWIFVIRVSYQWLCCWFAQLERNDLKNSWIYLLTSKSITALTHFWEVTADAVCSGTSDWIQLVLASW